MKILHIIPAYIPAYGRGGPIVSVHYLNKWLVRRGVEVVVYTTDIEVPDSVPRRVSVNQDGVRVFYFPASFPRKWGYSRAMHRALSKNVGDFDLVHITSTFLAASTLGAYYAKKFKKPYVISPRGNLMREPLKKKNSFIKKLYIALIEKKNLRNASAIHFTVEQEKEEYLQAGLPFKRAIVIPNGLDADGFETDIPHRFFRKKFKIDEDKKIILFLSRINWKKGLDTLVPAFARVVQEEPSAILILAGGDDEGYRKNVERWIDEYKVKNKVLFTGMILGADKTGALQDSDVFVLPSYSENFGMAVIEAMYFSLPVVVTEEVGISPSIARAGAGLVIKKNEKELTNAILEILNSPNLAKKMGDRGRRVVEKEFSLVAIAEHFIEVYNDLIRKK